MKSVIILSALLSLATAQIGIPECFCEPPICPLELGAECRCKNAAALKCYEAKLAQGFTCPKPTPKPCPREEKRVAEAAEDNIFPCHCEPVFCPLELVAECKCKNAAAETCYKEHLAQGINCPSPTPKVCGTNPTIVTRATPAPVPTCAGLLDSKCPDRMICIDKPDDGCDPQKGGSDCPGICVWPLQVRAPDTFTTSTKGALPTPTNGIKRCGFFPDGGCPAGEICVDDQNDNCDPKKVSDCPGFCKPKDAKKCGFMIDGGCPAGEVCVEDPTDKCDPKKVSDCPGFCKKRTPPAIATPVVVDTRAPKKCGRFPDGGCPDSQVCVLDPSTGCDPTKVSECPMICVTPDSCKAGC